MSDPSLQQPMAVLFVLPGLGTGGSERVVMNLCRDLPPSFEPVVAAFTGGALVETLRQSGVAVYVLDRQGGIDWRLVPRLLAVVRRHHIQVINSHHFVSLFYSFWVAKWAGIALVHSEHSRWEMTRLPRFWNLCFRFFLPRVAMVTAVSRGAYDHLHGHYRLPKKRLALLINGVDVDLFRGVLPNPALRLQLGVRENERLIATVGNLRPEKNQALLIRAMACLDPALAVKAVLIGDGECRSHLETLAHSLGVGERVIFAGTRHDTPQLYALMDIYTLTSRYEGLPLTLLEAMAAEVPIVATAVLGIEEVIADGYNGLLVKDDDAQALAAALSRLLNAPQLGVALAENGLKVVRRNYRYQNFVNGYAAIFRQVGGRNRRSAPRAKEILPWKAR